LSIKSIFSVQNYVKVKTITHSVLPFLSSYILDEVTSNLSQVAQHNHSACFCNYFVGVFI